MDPMDPLERLVIVTDDHEKRIRFIERWIAACGGAAAVIAFLWNLVHK